MAVKMIIGALDVIALQKLQAEMTSQILIIKFGAEWCGPCKKIAPAFQTFIQSAPANIIFADIDVDESLDLYMALKKNKMVTGIPVFFAYYGQSQRDKWFIPDDSIVGADEKLVAQFFERCASKALEISACSGGTGSGVQGYTYYT